MNPEDPAPELPTITAVIPTHNRCEGLRLAVVALLADSALSELIAVLDGCNDGTEAMLTELAATDSRVRTVVFPENRGRAVARQAGVESASGEVVLLVDDDVVASPGLAAGHARHHLMGRNAVVLGYMPVAKQDTSVARVYAREYESACERYETRPGAVLTSLWGGNFSLRRDRALQVGLLAPGFENRYHEDTDFGLRCLEAGMRGHFDRSLQATHHHERTVEQFLRDARSQSEGIELVRERHPTHAPPRHGTTLHLRPATVNAMTRALSPVAGRPGPLGTTALRALRRIHQAASRDV